MKQSFSKYFFMMLLLLFAFVAEAQREDRIVGKWQDTNHPEKQVEIFAKGNKYDGKAIGSEQSQNGKLIFRDLTWNKDSKTYNGVIIDPDNGKEHAIAISFVNPNRFKFKVSVFVFSKSFEFERVK